MPEKGAIAALQPAPWKADAACKGYPTDWFFAELAGDPHHYERAAMLCKRCPVRDECLEYALSLPFGADHGFWGGTSMGERRKIRRARALVDEARLDKYRRSIS